MNSLFQQVKSQVTARQAAERYGLQVSRSGMACCIFHQDKHPSMKVDRRYYCFACHATGDVIDLTAKLFGFSLYEAAKKLADDFGIRPLPPTQGAAIPKIPAALSAQKEEQRVLSRLVNCERTLKKWKEDFAPENPSDETWDERFVFALRHLTEVSHVIDCLLSPDANERKEMMAMLEETNMLSSLEAALDQHTMEVRDDGSDRAA